MDMKPEDRDSMLMDFQEAKGNPEAAKSFMKDWDLSEADYTELIKYIGGMDAVMKDKLMEFSNCSELVQGNNAVNDVATGKSMTYGARFMRFHRASKNKGKVSKEMYEEVTKMDKADKLQLFAAWTKYKECFSTVEVDWQISRSKEKRYRDLYGFRNEAALMKMYKDKALVDDLKKELKRKGDWRKCPEAVHNEELEEYWVRIDTTMAVDDVMAKRQKISGNAEVSGEAAKAIMDDMEKDVGPGGRQPIGDAPPGQENGKPITIKIPGKKKAAISAMNIVDAVAEGRVYCGQLMKDVEKMKALPVKLELIGMKSDLNKLIETECTKVEKIWKDLMALINAGCQDTSQYKPLMHEAVPYVKEAKRLIRVGEAIVRTSNLDPEAEEKEREDKKAKKEAADKAKAAAAEPFLS